MRLLGLGVIFILSCGGSTDDSSGGESSSMVDTSSWVDASACGLTFRAPPDITEEDVQGIDSCVTEHHTSSCSYFSDVGAYSSNLDEFQEHQDYQERHERLDGVDAKIVTAVSDGSARPYLVGVHMTELSPGSGTGATIVAECTAASDVAEALTVFRSIRVGAV